jgi:hypothetical protein
MRNTLKCGVPVALIFIGSVLLKRLWVPWGAVDPYAWVDPVLLNGASIVALTLGIRARKREHGSLRFGEGLWAGTQIAILYAALMTIFFLVVYAFVGEHLLAGEAASRGVSIFEATIQAFAGIFFGSIVVGAILSAVIAAFLRSPARS